MNVSLGSIIKYSLTIKDQYNTNKLNLDIVDGITINDQLYIKYYPEESKVKFFPILLDSDIPEYDSCISVDNLNKDKFTTTFVINNNLFVIERGEKD